MYGRRFISFDVKKLALVKLLRKSKSSNYGRIAMLQILSKIFDEITFDRMYSFLTKYEVFNWSHGTKKH